MTRSRALLFLPATFILVLLTALGAARYLYLRWNPAPPLRQAFVEGRILTMDEQNRIAEAVLIKGERIASVGSPDPEGGEIVRDASGRMTGLLKETAHEPLLEMALKVEKTLIGGVVVFSRQET